MENVKHYVIWFLKKICNSPFLNYLEKYSAKKKITITFINDPNMDQL